MKSWTLIAVLVLVAAATAAEELQTEAANHLRQGKQLIEANCGDCMGATQAGLEQGIKKVEEAIAAGYPNLFEAHALLGEAYRTLAYVYEEPNSEAQRAALQRYRTQCRELVDLAPKDAKIRYEYASSLAKPEDRRDAYREILQQLDPEYAPARFALGMLLVDTGERNSGVREIKRAIADEKDPSVRALYERRLQGIVGQTPADNR